MARDSRRRRTFSTTKGEDFENFFIDKLDAVCAQRTGMQHGGR